LSDIKQQPKKFKLLPINDYVEDDGNIAESKKDICVDNMNETKKESTKAVSAYTSR
jgi:hypothetical protein